ncbi:AAA family ATPase [Nocardioides sp.]|uniref:AAA family ATPase n=1 Tax=Nocardioides sp. TaxID=35761 RepID=UPI002BCB6D39|nr:AAA family ATPase [Nocardioides sp.]HXH78919.1 AAA family ATPase [Nocardioides sp.]
MATDSVIDALRAALVANPGDLGLRRHLASVLLDADRPQEALDELVQVLAVAPDDLAALRLAERASMAAGEVGRAAAYARLAASLEPEARLAATSSGTVPETAEELIGGWADTDAPAEPEIGNLSRPTMTLADVGGLAEVKQRLTTSFLTPMRNPELTMQFKKSLRGGLLLWGPPGCGKTFIARALAGELGADFYEVGLSDVLDMYVGNSERNLQSIFDTARRSRPCLLFFDEIDALGQKRSQLRHSGAMRGVVNQMLTELDGASSDNEGLFVLAASNHPWDIDSALLRPGRFDRRLLVLPPDVTARAAILAHHLAGRPQEGLDLAKVAKSTDGYSGADLALVCEQATESAMMSSLDSGDLRPITQRQLVDAARSVRPSIGEWMEMAKNYALYGNESGSYDELASYLRRRR